MKKIELFTDGACSGNPGPGGYGAILRCDGIEKEFSGGETNTTNNRMEIMAALVGLRALKYSCEVDLYSDSRYLVDSINKRWAYSWREKGWIKSDKKPAKNSDLFEELLDLLEIHKVTFIWVRGHNEHPENERCDKLAVMAREKFRK